MIKFLDLYKQDKILHKKILKKISNLFKNGDFILGKEVQIFENDIIEDGARHIKIPIHKKSLFSLLLSKKLRSIYEFLIS